MVFSATLNIAIVIDSFCVIKSVTYRWSTDQFATCSFPCVISPIMSNPLSRIIYALEALCSRQLMRRHFWLPGSSGETFISKEAAIQSTGVHRLTTMGWAEWLDRTLGHQFILTEDKGNLWLRSGLTEFREGRDHNCIKEIHFLH